MIKLIFIYGILCLYSMFFCNKYYCEESNNNVLCFFFIVIIFENLIYVCYVGVKSKIYMKIIF